MPHVVHGPNAQLSQWIADQFPEGYPGYAVDVGASDGISVNTTWWLEKHLRWTVLSVEANPDFAPALRNQRAFVEVCACDSLPGSATLHINTDNPEAYSALRVTGSAEHLKGAAGPWKKVPVRVETVDGLLRKWDFPRLDALCIDVEGCEREVLDGAALMAWKPRVIVVETWNPGSLDQYLGARGYAKKWRSVSNDLFLKEDTT